MKQPRCGNKDCRNMNRNESHMYCNNLMPTKQRFSYAVLKYPRLLTIQDVDEVILKGFEVWSNVSGICISKSFLSEQADIKIRFERGSTNTFDGKWNACSGSGTTVAHMNSPINGEIYFDDHEQWTTNFSNVGNSKKYYYDIKYSKNTVRRLLSH